MQKNREESDKRGGRDWEKKKKGDCIIHEWNRENNKQQQASCIVMLYISIVWCDSPGRVEYQKKKKKKKWGIYE